MLRRLHHEQPDTFAFTKANADWAKGQISKYPEGRQASAIIPLLWRAQEQEGWLSRAAIEHVAEMLDMAYIRALEVATFYFMFQLQPVGSVAHFQICGTTSCMICGAEGIVEVCKSKIAAKPHELSADGKFSWEEVECLGACANAPMAQIGKDYYEDLTPESFEALIEKLSEGDVPLPGSQIGRFSAEPVTGLTSLEKNFKNDAAHNGSVAIAVELNDTVKRIDGTEQPLRTPWLEGSKPVSSKSKKPASTVSKKAKSPSPVKVAEKNTVKPVAKDGKPSLLKKARKGGPDDLKQIKGVGPKLEALLHRLGVFHFDQVASWRKKEVDWVDDNLEGFKGRVSRDAWVKQAKVLARQSKK